MALNTNQYQVEVKRTMGDLEGKDALCNWAMGLSGEAGEVSEHIKKHVFHGRALDRSAVVKEIGDVLWYAAALCNTLNILLEDVMILNVHKLRERYPDGFVKASEPQG